MMLLFVHLEFISSSKNSLELFALIAFNIQKNKSVKNLNIFSFWSFSFPGYSMTQFIYEPFHDHVTLIWLQILSPNILNPMFI